MYLEVVGEGAIAQQLAQKVTTEHKSSTLPRIRINPKRVDLLKRASDLVISNVSDDVLEVKENHYFISVGNISIHSQISPVNDQICCTSSIKSFILLQKILMYKLFTAKSKEVGIGKMWTIHAKFNWCKLLLLSQSLNNIDNYIQFKQYLFFDKNFHSSQQLFPTFSKSQNFLTVGVML